jgi:hypothetical protein
VVEGSLQNNGTAPQLNPDSPANQQPEPSAAQTTPAQVPAAQEPPVAQAPGIPDLRDSPQRAQARPPELNPAGPGAPATGQTTGGPAATPARAVPTDDALIRQLFQRYATALEALSVKAVEDVYPSVNARTLQTAFNDYQSLQQTIAISRIDVSPNGQTATVVAAVTTAPVVKTGRAAPQTRTVTYTVRKKAATWVIETAR